MIFPWQLSTRLSTYLVSNKLRGRKLFPYSLMLEPTFRCNLACAGCGRIREYRDAIDKMLTVEDCLAAVREAAAPVICLTGGEPLLHPGIERIVRELLAAKLFVFHSSNGLLVEQALPGFKPSPYFSWVIHLDGLARTHDKITGRKGVFDTAVKAIRAAKKAGFKVCTNTTIYKETDSQEIIELFALLTQTGVDGIMVAPAFSYQAVDNDVFLSAEEFRQIFRPIYQLRHKFRLYNTPPYLEFLAGGRKLRCSPWSSPTRNPLGWKRPCYLITDGHCSSFRELMEDTPWKKYGVGNDPRCANCMVHCGFEASAIDAMTRSFSALWTTVKWNFC